MKCALTGSWPSPLGGKMQTRSKTYLAASIRRDDYAARSPVFANRMEEKLAEIFKKTGKQFPFHDIKSYYVEHSD
jgi:hypothetical protein